MGAPVPSPRAHRLLLALGLLLCTITGALLLDFTIPSTPYTRNEHIFPGLVSLRDTLVTFVFGAPPKAHCRPSATGAPNFTLTKYTKHFVARFNVTTADEALALKEAVHTMFLDVWAATPSYVDVRVRKADFDGVLSFLPKSMASSYTVILPDLVSLSAATYPALDVVDPIPQSISASGSSLDSIYENIDNVFFRDYQPLSVVTQWMRLLETMFPDIVDMIKIGKSYEGRDINALRIGSSPVTYDPENPRKTIIVTGGLHAREWISTSSVNYVAWSFISAYNKDTIITKMLQNFDMVFIPTLNPDGVEYTWETDRLWRKSRQHTNMRWCRGLDLDRAFGYEWDARSDPCSESYGGSEPFEAVEALQFADWARNEVANNNVNFVGLLDLHSYSQQVLFPYSYTCSVDPPNLENLEELGTGLVKAIRLTSGESYSLGAACEGVVAGEENNRREGAVTTRVEVGGGSFMDWIFHDLGVHYSYQIKLRDTGNYGFLLPKEYIVPTGEEVFSATKYFGDFLMGNNGIERGWKSSELKR